MYNDNETTVYILYGKRLHLWLNGSDLLTQQGSISTSLCFVNSEEKPDYVSELTQAGQLIWTHNDSRVPYMEECLWGILHCDTFFLLLFYRAVLFAENIVDWYVQWCFRLNLDASSQCCFITIPTCHANVDIHYFSRQFYLPVNANCTVIFLSGIFFCKL